MNLLLYSTKSKEKLQEVSQTWEKEILPHLPQNLENLARTSGSFQRKRGISSAVDFLKVLFLYAVSGISFRLLAAAAYGLGISDISDTAWRKKCAKAVPFLHEVLHETLSTMFPPVSIKHTHRQVLLLDASIIRQTGKKQHQQRIHTCYSLNQNRMHQIQVTDHHTAESFQLFSFHKNDIVLADAGYGKARNYAYAMKQGCDVILRITPNQFSFLDANGNKVDLCALLKEMEHNKENDSEWFGFCQQDKKLYPVRLLAQKLPKEKAMQSRKRKQRKAQKNGYHIKEKTLFYAEYMILITSLGVEYDREEILSLYRSRWQVELLFKRFKQNLSILTLRAGNPIYAEAVVLLWLLIWILTEKQVFLTERFLKEKEEEQERIFYSCWELCRLAFFQTKEILCLSWSLFVNFKNGKIRHYLSPSKRHRINQNQDFHSNILPGLLS